MVPSLAGEGDGEVFVFLTEVLILSKYSGNISAHAKRINSSQLQCNFCLCVYFCVVFFVV